VCSPLGGPARRVVDSGLSGRSALKWRHRAAAGPLVRSGVPLARVRRLRSGVTGSGIRTRTLMVVGKTLGSLVVQRRRTTFTGFGRYRACSSGRDLESRRGHAADAIRSERLGSLPYSGRSACRGAGRGLAFPCGIPAIIVRSWWARPASVGLGCWWTSVPWTRGSCGLSRVGSALRAVPIGAVGSSAFGGGGRELVRVRGRPGCPVVSLGDPFRRGDRCGGGENQLRRLGDYRNG